MSDLKKLAAKARERWRELEKDYREGNIGWYLDLAVLCEKVEAEAALQPVQAYLEALKGPDLVPALTETSKMIRMAEERAYRAGYEKGLALADKVDEMRDDAIDELMELLHPDEKVEAVVFGNWAGREKGKIEPDAPVPLDKRGLVLSLEEAAPFMHGWSFYCGHGSPQCYAIRIWTTQRVFWVTQYDGATGLGWTPRHPAAHMPDMPGRG